MKSAVTISLVSEARGGPFVFHDDLPAACRTAKELGFDAVELFAPGPNAVAVSDLKAVLGDNGLSLAAVGTGAGWVKHKLTLTNADAGGRRKAMDFVKSMIDFGANFNAPAIIGSMQGRWGDGTDKATATGHLAESLAELGGHAAALIYEPLNRYETNFATRLEEGVELLKRVGRENVKLLADLFHMNIEEVNLADALKATGRHVGHVHLADSNRRPAGSGHTDFAPIAAALKEIGYAGYVSAEAFPYPDSKAAAKATIQAFRKHFA
ncbi:sugar phosphate isomerase/epimerase family protein [Limnoglobus roseus]|uniref:Sugar phosphate isomerase/epimerase n=1 Tax=Limnoglobus roseus TaxID=2598579 RepID=A0A5C1AGC5_9BACT|nr:sugar phosphate isomerase/epimerase family protein [Limnoglobus roseus]QEL17293.1 sugar phosphate isomerase/epimerase [Limnoglobus roseus]